MSSLKRLQEQEALAEAAPDVSGTILIDGSSTVAPLTEVAAEFFMGEFSNGRVTVAASGTSGGFQKSCLGETDGNSASLSIKESEIDECANVQGVARVSDRTAFFATEVDTGTEFSTGLVEVNETGQIFSNPADERTENYVTGRFG